MGVNLEVERNRSEEVGYSFCSPRRAEKNGTRSSSNRLFSRAVGTKIDVRICCTEAGVRRFWRFLGANLELRRSRPEEPGYLFFSPQRAEKNDTRSSSSRLFSSAVWAPKNRHFWPSWACTCKSGPKISPRPNRPKNRFNRVG